MWRRGFCLLGLVLVSVFLGYLIGDWQSETVTLPPTSASGFVVSNLSIQPEEVQPNEIVAITLSVANTHDTWGAYSLVLMIDGVKETEGQVTVAAGSTQDITFIVTRAYPDSYTVFINGLSGSFTVVVQ